MEGQEMQLRGAAAAAGQAAIIRDAGAATAWIDASAEL